MKEADLRTQILNDVKEYMNLQEAKAALNSGDYIPYASRVYDEEEVTNLVDAALEFWLTSGRYTKEFESKLAEYLKICLVLWHLLLRCWGSGGCVREMR